MMLKCISYDNTHTQHEYRIKAECSRWMLLFHFFDIETAFNGNWIRILLLKIINSITWRYKGKSIKWRIFFSKIENEMIYFCVWSYRYVIRKWNIKACVCLCEKKIGCVRQWGWDLWHAVITILADFGTDDPFKWAQKWSECEYHGAAITNRCQSGQHCQCVGSMSLNDLVFFFHLLSILKHQVMLVILLTRLFLWDSNYWLPMNTCTRCRR